MSSSFELLFLIKFCNNIFVQFFSFVSLDLHGICKESFIHERGWFQINVFSLFETLQSALFSSVIKMFQNLESNFFILTKFLEWTFNFFLSSNFHDFLFVWYSNNNTENFGRLSVKENFINIVRFQIKVFNFFSSDIFTLLKFENILLSINDLESSCVG